MLRYRRCCSFPASAGMIMGGSQTAKKVSSVGADHSLLLDSEVGEIEDLADLDRVPFFGGAPESPFDQFFF